MRRPSIRRPLISQLRRVSRSSLRMMTCHSLTHATQIAPGSDLPTAPRSQLPFKGIGARDPRSAIRPGSQPEPGIASTPRYNLDRAPCSAASIYLSFFLATDSSRSSIRRVEHCRFARQLRCQPLLDQAAIASALSHQHPYHPESHCTLYVLCNLCTRPFLLPVSLK
jgi:hypothetical protein